MARVKVEPLEFKKSFSKLEKLIGGEILDFKSESDDLTFYYGAGSRGRNLSFLSMLKEAGVTTPVTLTVLTADGCELSELRNIPIDDIRMYLPVKENPRFTATIDFKIQVDKKPTIIKTLIITAHFPKEAYRIH